MVQALQVLQHADTTRDQRLKNIALEVFLLHYRNIRHFLWPREPVFPDDILAEDFFAPDSIPHEFEYQSVKRKDAVTAKLNKQLAHLSYVRLDYHDKPEKNWDIPTLLREIVTGLQVLFSKLPDARKPMFTEAENILSKVRFQEKC